MGRKTSKNTEKAGGRKIILEAINREMKELLPKLTRSELVASAIRTIVMRKLANISDNPKDAGKEIGEYIAKRIGNFLSSALLAAGENSTVIAPMIEGIRKAIIRNLMTDNEKHAIDTLNRMIF